MSTLIIQPDIPIQHPSPVRIALPGGETPEGPALALVDAASGERLPAQRDGPRAIIAVLGPLAGERRFRLEAAPPGAAGMEVRQTAPHQVEIRINGQPLTIYHFEPANARPFFHPLIGPGGAAVTRHFPMDLQVPGESKDHPHHRSMWSAYGEVNGTDNWSEEKNHARQVPQGEPETMEGPVFGRLTARNLWVGPDGRPQLDEQRSLTAYAVGPEQRLFDYEITFTARYCDVQFGDTKEGGLLSFRVASSMDASRGGRIENSAGGVGEKECWGKPAAWCDYSGPVGSETVGVGVMDHPGNFRSPVHWHVRDYGLMTTNCFGDSAFAGEERGHAGDYRMKAGQALTFRYRVLLHRGEAEGGDVAGAFAAFTHPPVTRVE